jgi:lysylphosphatidylglycerol synthetase-like protein (DUF2156 family)
MSTSSSSSKLAPSLTWLFAAGALILGVAAAYLLRGFSSKVTAGAYAAIVGAAGFASTYLTRARVRLAVLAFLTAAAVAAIAYFFLVSHIFNTVTTVMTDAVSGGQAHAEGVKAGSVFGTFFGIFAAIVAFIETAVAGIVGAVAGDKAKAAGGISLAPATRVTVR